MWKFLFVVTTLFLILCLPSNGVKANDVVVNHPVISRHLSLVEQAHDASVDPRFAPSWPNTWSLDVAFDAIHMSPSHLASSLYYMQTNPGVAHAIIIGSILFVWYPVVHDLLAADTDAVSMLGEVLNAYTHRPPPVVSCMQDPAILGRIMQAMYVAVDIIQAELQFYAGINHIDLQTPQSSPSGRDLVLAWWANYDALATVIARAHHMYISWRNDIIDWVTYTSALGINTHSLILALHLDPSIQSSVYQNDPLHNAPLTLLTSKFLQQIEDNRFLFSHPNNVLIPYASQVPILLETASATKMAQMYCTDFKCTPAMLDVIQTVHYGSQPAVLHELTHFLTEQRRWMDKDDLSVAQQNARLAGDKYRYTISLPTECRKNKQTRLLCDMCSYYMTPIQFYLSQVDILHAYRDDLPYLLDLMPVADRRVIPLDFDRFNDQLSKTYRDVAIFFNLNDPLLSYWLMKDWKVNINDLYVLFREDPELLQSNPPTELLDTRDMATHRVDLNTWTLQSFWRRFFEIVKTNRNAWWERLLNIALAYDAYAQRTPMTQISHNPLSLTLQCQNTKSIFDCVSLLHTVLTRPDLDPLFTTQQRRGMLQRSQLLYGKLDLYEDMAETLRDATSSSLRLKIRRMFSSPSPGSPSSGSHSHHGHRRRSSTSTIQIPALPTLVSDNEMLQGDDGRYMPNPPITQETTTRVFTVDPHGYIVDPHLLSLPPSTSMPPPVSSSAAAAAAPQVTSQVSPPAPPRRPRLQQQKSFWRQFNH